jgi:hypothetical protein
MSAMTKDDKDKMYDLMNKIDPKNEGIAKDDFKKFPAAKDKFKNDPVQIYAKKLEDEKPKLN